MHVPVYAYSSKVCWVKKGRKVWCSPLDHNVPQAAQRLLLYQAMCVYQGRGRMLGAARVGDDKQARSSAKEVIDSTNT